MCGQNQEYCDCFVLYFTSFLRNSCWIKIKFNVSFFFFTYGMFLYLCVLLRIAEAVLSSCRVCIPGKSLILQNLVLNVIELLGKIGLGTDGLKPVEFCKQNWHQEMTIAIKITAWLNLNWHLYPASSSVLGLAPWFSSFEFLVLKVTHF